MYDKTDNHDNGMMVRGTSASLPPTMEITKINSNRKGKSTIVNKLALVINSRTASNSRRLLAYEPEEAGRSAKRNAITRRNKAELMIRSAFFTGNIGQMTANHLGGKFKQNRQDHADAQYPQGFIGLVGITRSYTFITYKELTSARKLMMMVAKMTW